MDEPELIKEKIDIVELIQEYLPLKKTGINFKANCPFHQEKTPSFIVSPERQIFRCFGCEKSGDIFTFVMEKEGMEFKDALEYLASKAGVVLKRGEGVKGKGERLFEANEKAAQFFNYFLNQPLGKKALDYFKKRGLTDETISQFNLGYAPQNWEALTKFLKKRGFSEKEMIEAGLGVPSQRGCYDRFRGRIMFPLLDIRSRVIGFAGRVLDSGEPKYINTPQTAIFDKRRLLFGFNLSKGAVREKKEAILVEGEMDMIMSFQEGVKNIVATKGTALTAEHIETLKKYTDTISLCFDTDLAGDAASRRGIEMADQALLNIKVIQVAGAKDPAELCLKDPTKWQEAVDQAIPIYDYYLNSVQKRYEIKTAQGKRGVFLELVPIWRKITDPIVKDHYTQKLAALLQTKEELIKKELEKTPSVQISDIRNQISDKKLDGQRTDDKMTVASRRSLLEEYLISLILHIPPDHTYVPNFPEIIFLTESLKQIYVMLVLFLDSISFKGVSFKISEFIKTLPKELIEIVDRLYLIQIDEKLSENKHWQKEVGMVVGELKKMLIKSSLEKLSLQIKSAQEFAKIEQLEVLNKRFRDLSVKLKNL